MGENGEIQFLVTRVRGQQDQHPPEVLMPYANPPSTQHVHQVRPGDRRAIEDLHKEVVGKLVVVRGQPGSGRSTVGGMLGGTGALSLDANDLVRGVIDEARHQPAPAGGWPHRSADALVVDEVGWLDGRPRTLELLREALQRRRMAGQTTVLVQGRKDESLPELLVGLAATFVDLALSPRAVHTAT